MASMIARADVFLQNLAPGAGVLPRLRRGRCCARAHPRLVTCDISGYGEEPGRLQDWKAYDLLVQAESGLVSVSGDAPRRMGPHRRLAVRHHGRHECPPVGIQQALLARARTGRGSGVHVWLFICIPRPRRAG